MREIEFEDSLHYTGPAVTDELVALAEARLGYRLPASLISVLRMRNGGVPRKRRIWTGFQTSWARDHFEISAIRGVGGSWGVDTDGPLSSSSLVAEWGYPDIGIVLCDMPSGGHDAVMLDYRTGGAEPAVAYVDEDRVPRTVAESVSDFIDRLEAGDSSRGPS